MWIHTIDGQRVFDWGGYYGSKLLGHNRPELRRPAYLRRLALAAGTKLPNPDFLSAECLAYYRLVHALAPRVMRNPRLEVYAVNSGAEAVENMMKYLINLHDEKQRRRGSGGAVRRFIYFDQAFHGRTVFALNITRLAHDPVITKNFRGIVAGNIQVAFPHYDSSRPMDANRAEMERCLASIEDSLQRHRGEIVAIVVEPIQGAGGHRVSLPEFFRKLSILARRYDTYLGFDEVQTAGGQTGSVFAIDQFDLPYPPQAVATAKKFANGVVYMLRPMKDQGVLDSTWGGSLADMVRFVAEWEIVEREDLIGQVRGKADALVDGLTRLADRYPEAIFNVRGMGLYQGFSLRHAVQRRRLIHDALERESLLLLGAGQQSLRFRPPLDVTVADIDRMVRALGRLVPRLAGRTA